MMSQTHLIAETLAAASGEDDECAAPVKNPCDGLFLLEAKAVKPKALLEDFVGEHSTG